MLLSTAGVNNNERVAFIRNRTLIYVIDKIEQLNAIPKMESIEAKVTDLVEEKINETMRKTHEIVEESYASVVNKVEDNKKLTMSKPQRKAEHVFTTTLKGVLEYKGSQKIQTKLVIRILFQHMNM